MSNMTVHVPDTIAAYSNDLHRFFDAMVYKLAKNASKGRWEDMRLGTALELLEQEIVELKEALNNGNTVEVVLEAADVANFALITANIAIDRGGK